MRRADLEHVIAAAANVLGEDAFVVIGSQAILGPCPRAVPHLGRRGEDGYLQPHCERALGRGYFPTLTCEPEIL